MRAGNHDLWLATDAYQAPVQRVTENSSSFLESVSVFKKKEQTGQACPVPGSGISVVFSVKGAPRVVLHAVPTSGPRQTGHSQKCLFTFHLSFPQILPFPTPCWSGLVLRVVAPLKSFRNAGPEPLLTRSRAL